MKNKLINTIKNFLKKSSILVKIKRNVSDTLSDKKIYSLIVLLIKKIKLENVFQSNFFKKYLFFHSDQQYFVVNNLNDFYVVPAKDPEISSNIFFNNDKRKSEIKSLRNFRKICTYVNRNINNFIDVGASIGNILIPAVSQNLFKKAIAFEPSEKNYSLCKINIILNNLSGLIQLQKCAVTNRDNEILDLEIHNFDVGDHRIRYKTYQGLLNEHLRKVEKVQSYSLDNLLNNIDCSNSGLWLNNQGSESQTISGGMNILKKNQMPIFLEFSPYYISNSDSFELLTNSFEDLNYSKVFDAYNLDFLGKPEKKFFLEKFKQLGIKTRAYRNFIII
jgi:FkbM family methyltransferase